MVDEYAKIGVQIPNELFRPSQKKFGLYVYVFCYFIQFEVTISHGLFSEIAYVILQMDIIVWSSDKIMKFIRHDKDSFF